MADQLTDVLVAGYPDVDAATKDFDDLVAAVKAKTVRIEGAILVTHDKDGNVVVQQTGDNLGPQGRWATAARSASSSAWPRRRCSRRPSSGPPRAGSPAASRSTRWRPASTTRSARRSSRARPPIIAMFDEDQGLAVQQVLAGALARSVVQTDKSGTGRAEGLARRGDGQVQPGPDRAADPGPQRSAASIGRTMDTSVGDWSMIPGPKAPDGAPNVLIVLIDDAGFGGPETFGGEIRTPEPDARPADGPDLQPLPRDGRLLADARRAAHRAQPPPRGHGRHRGVPGPVPGLHGDAAAELHGPAADPQGERVHHRRLRQVAHDAGPRDGPRGAVRALAAGVGLRPLVGLPDRRGRPVRPDHHPGQLGPRRARGQGREALLLPGRHHGQVGRVAPRGPRP